MRRHAGGALPGGCCAAWLDAAGSVRARCHRGAGDGTAGDCRRSGRAGGDGAARRDRLARDTGRSRGPGGGDRDGPGPRSGRAAGPWATGTGLGPDGAGDAGCDAGGLLDDTGNGMTEKQKMLAGELYDASDPELQAERDTAARWMLRYNAAVGLPAAERLAMLREQLAAAGDGTEIRPPFHCDYGSNISLGERVFLNFNCVILDVVSVTIGDGTQIGPGVQIYAADHPRDPAMRRSGREFGRPV